ncbi:MAG: hypothetical protein IT450_16315 [Phycisphaerales bacterium]|nr:hypothetical protein [Phycisphaerales bacterium]
MHRAELIATLEREGIRPDAVDLTNRGGTECLVLEKESERWIVYYSERGLRSGLKSFGNESDACHYILDRLRKDPSARATRLDA